MEFELLLHMYLRNIENLQHRYLRNLITEDARDVALNINRYWFGDVVYFSRISDYYKEVAAADLTPELKHKYDIAPDTYPLNSVIFYRDHEIPCYDDDYGQQVFAIYNGETWSGGSYNLAYAADFCRMLDDTLEDELLDRIAAEYADGKPKKPMFFSEFAAAVDDGSDGE